MITVWKFMLRSRKLLVDVKAPSAEEKADWRCRCERTEEASYCKNRKSSSIIVSYLQSSSPNSRDDQRCRYAHQSRMLCSPRLTSLTAKILGNASWDRQEQVVGVGLAVRRYDRSVT